jgi:DNA-binding SARP family transcriptional activator
MSNSALMTLGGFSFQVDGQSTPGPATRKARALMTFLIMNRRADAARERLLELFWPEADPDRARDSLKTALWSIRRCLRTAGVDPDRFLQATKSTLRWTADTSVDAEQFAELATREDATRQALDLFRGDFLEGDYDNWAVAERERMASLYESVLARIVRTSKDAEAAQLFIGRNPYNEDAYAALIEAELSAGRRSSAASWVERCRKALSEIGEKPSTAFEARFGSVVLVEPVVSDELSLPFAGREAELGLLAAKITDASTGNGSITFVHGEAGIGKSTLLNRAAHIARESGERVLHVRCSTGLSDAFGPWQGVFHSVESNDFDTFVRAHVGDVTSAIARAIVSRLNKPTIIIVDDAHELSGDALEVFIAMVRAASTQHMVVAGLRPEGVSTMRSRIEDLEFEEIPLMRLDRKHLKWALSQTLGNDQPEVLDVLYGRSGGHPLFFTGLLNALVNGGALARQGGRWRLVKPMDANMELPDTVKRFIETRLQARGDTPRAVACALALEPAANADDLASVLHLEEATVLDALDDLLALGLITQPPAGAQFAFTHDLVREVAGLGLNAGRRTALHRAFAQRLAASGELEASLRLAKHFQNAGEFLASAQSYLKSAQAALELNAAQDTLERCDAGIAAAGRLERSTSRDAVLAKLLGTSARAQLAIGLVNEAIKQARAAVAAARSVEDLHEWSQALLDLAVMEGAAFQTLEQRSEAAEAARIAAVCSDDILEAQAHVQSANAARQLGQKDAALEAARTAGELAQRLRRSDIEVAALEELLLAQLTWWQFGDALESARRGLDAARRSSPMAESAFRQARCACWYLLDRFDEAKSELALSMQLAREAAAHPHEGPSAPIHASPVINWMGQYMSAKIAHQCKHWDEALAALERATAVANVARLPRYAEGLALLKIDTLWERNLPDDLEAAHDIVQGLGDASYPQGIVGWSDCVELARARDASRRHEANAPDLLHRTLNLLEENAHQAPLEIDRAFDRLASAANEIGESAIAARARERSRYYRSRRRAAAGAAWGGEASTLSSLRS